MKLAEKIYQERRKLGLSQEQFAEQMDISRQAVSKWESGQSMPDLDKIVAMSQIFGVTTDYLLKEEESSYNEIPNEADVDFTYNEMADESESYNEKNTCADRYSCIVRFWGKCCIFREYFIRLRRRRA